MNIEQLVGIEIIILFYGNVNKTLSVVGVLADNGTIILFEKMMFDFFLNQIGLYVIYTTL